MLHDRLQLNNDDSLNLYIAGECTVDGKKNYSSTEIKTAGTLSESQKQIHKHYLTK